MRRICTLLTIALFCLSIALLPNLAAAQAGNTWQVFYYGNNNWQGNPVYFQNAATVNFNWGSDTPPGPGMPAQNWTARLVTTAFFYAGIYNFTLQADDEFALYVDNILYADTRGANQPGKIVTIAVPLNQGNHYIDIEYRQYTGPAYLFATWDFVKNGNIGPTPAPPQPPPVGPKQPFPPPTDLVTEFGNYTPCAQQNIHQSNCFVSDGAWNSPNLGSIQMEPQIIRWQICTPDAVQQVQLWQNYPTVSAKCSKTAAGWFQN